MTVGLPPRRLDAHHRQHDLPLGLRPADGGAPTGSIKFVIFYVLGASPPQQPTSRRAELDDPDRGRERRSRSRHGRVPVTYPRDTIRGRHSAPTARIVYIPAMVLIGLWIVTQVISVTTETPEQANSGGVAYSPTSAARRSAPSPAASSRTRSGSMKLKGSARTTPRRPLISSRLIAVVEPEQALEDRLEPLALTGRVQVDAARPSRPASRANSSSFKRRSSLLSSISLAVLSERPRRGRLLLTADQVGLGRTLGLDDLVDQLADLARQDHVLHAELLDHDTELTRALSDERPQLGVEPIARRQECRRAYAPPRPRGSRTA